MTATQISYWTLQEAKKHNRTTEGQTDRDLGIKASTLSESIRHNKVSENLTASQIKETHRRNTQDYKLGKGQLAVSKGNLKVSQNAQKETARSNRANEAIRQEANRIQAQNVANQWKKIQSEIGVNNATELLKYAEKDLTNKENEYYVYSLLARAGDIGALCAVLGVSTKGITESDKEQFKSYFTSDYKTKPKSEYKPSSKFAKVLNDLLHKLETTNWKPIITQ